MPRAGLWKGWDFINNTSRAGYTEKMTLEQSLAGEGVSRGAEAMVLGRGSSLRRLAMCLRSREEASVAERWESGQEGSRR